MHDFYIDTNQKFIRFDVVMSLDIYNKKGLTILKTKLLKNYPN